MNRPLSTSLVLLSSVAAAHAQHPLSSLAGQAGERFGAAVARAGDQNADGVEDLLVGAPGVGAGKVVCVSGAWLASGTGASVLWTLNSPTNIGGEFGSQIAAVGNLTGDAKGDFVISAPNYRPPASSITTGALFVVDGATHTIVNYINGEANTRLGIKLCAVGDRDHDGLPEVAATATYTTTFGANKVYVIPGSSLLSIPPGLSLLPHWTMIGADGFGDALASGFDLDGDGEFDLAVSSTRDGSGNSQDAGRVIVVDSGPGFASRGSYTAGIFGEHLGTSLDVRDDYDHDGFVDIVAGAPDWVGTSGQKEGRAVVISGARLLFGNGPFEMYVFKGGAGQITPGPGWRLGSAVRATPDINGDGVGDLMIGMPDFYTQLPLGPGKGGVRIFSGATGHSLGAISGLSNERLGDTLAGPFADLDGDGFPELAIAGSLADSPATDSGILKVYSPFTIFPTVYCTGKVNSQGCTPTIGAGGSGFASASSPAPFLVTCAQVLNQKSGVLFYSHQANAMPFQGGLLCVKSPITRTGAQNSGGSTTGTDCSGTYSFDFTPRIQGGLDPSLVVGAEIFCQYWARDVQSPSGTSLSNALHFVINP